MATNNDRKLITILVLFSAGLFFVGLGKMALTDPDEVFYAETAKEMLRRGEFLTPYIFGKPQFEKPPLYYWLVMFGFRVFGINEFSARVFSAAFGVLGVIGVYLLGRILVNRRTGFLAGIILATNVKYMILSRACVTDIVLCVFILYAFLFFFYGHRSRGLYFLSAVALGLAVLTKGPIGVFLPVVIIAIYLVFSKEMNRLQEIPLVQCMFLFLAVSLPWYILMYKVHGREFIDVFFGFHNVIRFLKPEHRLGDVFYYYAPVVLAGFFPWSIFLPVGIWQVFREKEEGMRKTNILLIAWILVVFIFFSISRTKLPTYVFPLYPAVALLTGRFVDVFLENGLTSAQKRAVIVLACIFFITLIGGILALYTLARIKYPTIIGMIFIIGTTLIVSMGIFVWMVSRRRYMGGISVYMAGFLIFAFLSSYFLSPELGKYESSKYISRRLLELAKRGEEIGAETQYRRGVAFYTDRENIPDIHRHHIMTNFFSKKSRVWGVLKEKNYDFLYDDIKKPFDKRTYVVYKFGKKVIVTNKKPSDGKFLRMRPKNARP